MNNKITFPELTKLLAQTSGYSEEICDAFLRELFTIVSDTITEGDSVKIKGIGTFKSTRVEERKSINVNTGAEMVIPGHRKVNFTPDKSLAEAINAPFAMFEPVEVQSGITDEMLSAEDDYVMAEDEQETSTVSTIETLVQTTNNAETRHIDNALADNCTKAEEAVSIDMQPTTKAQEQTNVEEVMTGTCSDNDKLCTCMSVPENEDEPSPTLIKESIETQDSKRPLYDPRVDTNTDHTAACGIYKQKQHSNRKSFYRGIILGLLGAIVLIAALLAGWRMLAPESFCRVTGTSLANPGTYTAQNNLQIESAEIIAPNTEHYNKYKNDTTPASETKNAADDSKVEELADKPSSTEDEVPTKPSDITTSDKVKESSKTDKKNVEKKRYDTITKKRFLTTMAKEYYGDYNLWPFIYDENKAILGHPDRIKPGTRVVIPPASKYGIDASNAACVAKAKRRGQQIYSKYRR